jgi:plasmid maintenance system antidote protein VapI
LGVHFVVLLERAFGGSADTWLRMQAAYDLAQARQHEEQIDVHRNAVG